MVTVLQNVTGDFSVTETTDNQLLTAPAIALIDQLQRAFDSRRVDLLAERPRRRAEFREGRIAKLEGTKHIRDAEWSVQPLPQELLERRVELLGGARPQDLVIGMNSGAKTFIADLQNFTSMQEASLVQAHNAVNLAVRRELEFTNVMGDNVRIAPSSEARIGLVPRRLDKMCMLIKVNDEPVSAALVDIVLHCYHNLAEVLNTQGAVMFTLRGVQNHFEARWYNDLFNALEEHFHVSRGSIRATVMVDQLSTALELDEILFEMQDHSAGMCIDPQAFALDHISLFSAPDREVLPDREEIGLSSHMLRSLSHLVIGVCHRRKAHALGAPAFIVPPDDDGNTHDGFAEMIADKEREAVDGHDGTLVAHPGLVNAATMEFNKSMPRAHQMYYVRKDKIQAADLIKRPIGSVTTDSLKALVKTALSHGVAQRMGLGWSEYNGRIHDRSSRQLAVALLWQWSSCKSGVVSSTGLEVTDDLVKFLVHKEVERMLALSDEATREAAEETAKDLIKQVLAEEMPW